MAKYKFENFNVELIDPTIESVGNNGFTIGDEFVTVFANLSTGTASLKQVIVGKMPNADGWNDDDLLKFATEQLETFKIKE